MSDVIEQPKLALRNLSVLSYANGFTHWHYKGTKADVLTPGYFDTAADMLTVGDMITVMYANVFVVSFERGVKVSL